MNPRPDLKQAVLRGVYEDNLGIPRSCHGTGRARPAPAAPPAGSGYRGRLALVVVLGLAALFGINFRLVTVDGSGPVAMQVAQQQPWQAPDYRQLVPPGTPFGRHAGEDLPAEPVSTGAINEAVPSTGQYDAVFAHLGIPMADLFDLEIQTIVIDPGHGGIDPGATGPSGVKEKDIALDIARRLRDKLLAAGNYRVMLTRDEDRKMFLKERVGFAKDNRADLFISVHINSLPAEAGSLNYVETYYFGPHTDQRSLALAEYENHESDYAMGDFRRVIARIGDTLKTQESRQLAASIHRHLYRNLKRHAPGLVDAGAKTGPFMVLLGVEVPSVLVEVSCISNRAEEARLDTPQYRSRVADFLKAGVLDYLEQRAYRRTIEGGKTHYVAKQER